MSQNYEPDSIDISPWLIQKNHFFEIHECILHRLNEKATIVLAVKTEDGSNIEFEDFDSFNEHIIKKINNMESISEITISGWIQEEDVYKHIWLHVDLDNMGALFHIICKAQKISDIIDWADGIKREIIKIKERIIIDNDLLKLVKRKNFLKFLLDKEIRIHFNDVVKLDYNGEINEELKKQFNEQIENKKRVKNDLIDKILWRLIVPLIQMIIGGIFGYSIGIFYGVPK